MGDTYIKEETESQTVEYAYPELHEDDYIPIRLFGDEYVINKRGDIKSKSSNKLIKIRPNNGYQRIYLKYNHYYYKKYLHRLLAETFIMNNNKYRYVDHINRDKSDNSVSNLRWVSRSQNSRNKLSNRGIKYVFKKQLSVLSKVVVSIRGHKVKNIYYDCDEFYMYIDEIIGYRKLVLNKNNNHWYYRITDIHNKRFYFSLNQYLEEYNCK